MQDLASETPRAAARPMFASGFVSQNWSSAGLDEGPGLIAMSILLGAFCGLILGLITFNVARFLSFAMGRHVGGLGWTLVCMALGALAFGLMSARDAD